MFPEEPNEALVHQTRPGEEGLRVIDACHAEHVHQQPRQRQHQVWVLGTL